MTTYYTSYEYDESGNPTNKVLIKINSEYNTQDSVPAYVNEDLSNAYGVGQDLSASGKGFKNKIPLYDVLSYLHSINAIGNTAYAPNNVKLSFYPSSIKESVIENCSINIISNPDGSRTIVITPYPGYWFPEITDIQFDNADPQSLYDETGRAINEYGEPMCAYNYLPNVAYNIAELDLSDIESRVNLSVTAQPARYPYDITLINSNTPDNVYDFLAYSINGDYKIGEGKFIATKQRNYTKITITKWRNTESSGNDQQLNDGSDTNEGGIGIGHIGAIGEESISVGNEYYLNVEDFFENEGQLVLYTDPNFIEENSTGIAITRLQANIIYTTSPDVVRQDVNNGSYTTQMYYNEAPSAALEPLTYGYDIVSMSINAPESFTYSYQMSPVGKLDNQNCLTYITITHKSDADITDVNDYAFTDTDISTRVHVYAQVLEVKPFGRIFIGLMNSDQLASICYFDETASAPGVLLPLRFKQEFVNTSLDDWTIDPSCSALANNDNFMIKYNTHEFESLTNINNLFDFEDNDPDEYNGTIKDGKVWLILPTQYVSLDDTGGSTVGVYINDKMKIANSIVPGYGIEFNRYNTVSERNFTHGDIQYSLFYRGSNEHPETQKLIINSIV